MEESVGHISVVCRFRPLNETELKVSSHSCVDVQDPRCVRLYPGKENSEPLCFAFDSVLPPTCSQIAVHTVVGAPIAEAVMEGFNGTVLAYGQTSSGKTFTMTGPSSSDPAQKGLVPRVVHQIFSSIAAAPSHMEFTVSVSYAEIYMESIRDLLEPTRHHLKVQEDRTKGVIIKDLSEHSVASPQEVLKYLELGSQSRSVSSTNMNEA